jgi:hypothetical protein
LITWIIGALLAVSALGWTKLYHSFNHAEAESAKKDVLIAQLQNALADLKLQYGMAEGSLKMQTTYIEQCGTAGCTLRKKGGQVNVQ